ncbi:MAG: glutamate--cysteine ligase [Bdellovibrio sp.]
MSTPKINTKLQLDGFVCQHWNEINNFIDDQMANLPVPIYSSVDIRESLDKYAPVDHNMYPAGFNNVCALDLEACSREFSRQIKKINPNAKVVGLIPESHTKNLFYLDHLAILSKTIRDAGFEVIITSPDHQLFADGSNELKLVSHSQFDLSIFPTTLSSNILSANGKELDVVVLNNDQSSPLELPWREIKSPIVPTPLIGWFARQKIKHFTYYNKVASVFAEKFNIDPNLLEARFSFKDDVDFSTKEGIDELASEVDKLIAQIGKPNPVFVKASQGTYGMGIMVVKSGEEIKEMNRRDRNKMDVGKNKIKFTSVIIQEGIETALKYDNMPAEVTIYLVGGKSLGGFMRANQERGSNENLNAKGMVFRKYCISEIKQNQDYQCKEAVYSILARLSTWAAALEIEEAIK